MSNIEPLPVVRIDGPEREHPEVQALRERAEDGFRFAKRSLPILQDFLSDMEANNDGYGDYVDELRACVAACEQIITKHAQR